MSAVKEPGITAELAEFALAPTDFPPEVNAAGVRSFVNIVGCALGGVHHRASELAFDVNNEFAGAPVATLIGRGRLVDVLSAAYLNCLAASADAFDDTHLSTVLHPAGPVLGALYQRRKILTRKGFPFWAGCDSRLAKEIRHVSMHCSSGRLRQH